MVTPTPQQSTVPQYHDEQILVVPRTALFPQGAWHGLKAIDLAQFTATVRECGQFLPRAEMEVNPAYKQIIPYLIFENNGRYFVMERRAEASEQRLKSKLSLGIGGHIRIEDIDGTDIATWARREFDEEVSYDGNYTIELLGALNDDSNPVGEVHIGIVYLLRGNSHRIAIKSEHKSGSLMTFDECMMVKDRCENWSQIVLEFLAAKHRVA